MWMQSFVTTLEVNFSNTSYNTKSPPPLVFKGSMFITLKQSEHVSPKYVNPTATSLQAYLFLGVVMVKCLLCLLYNSRKTQKQRAIKIGSSISIVNIFCKKNVYIIQGILKQWKMITCKISSPYNLFRKVNSPPPLINRSRMHVYAKYKKECTSELIYNLIPSKQQHKSSMRL